MEIIFFLLIIFGIYRLFRRKGSTQTNSREQFLHNQITELSRIAYHTPNKTIAEQLKEYKEELNQIQHGYLNPEVKNSSTPTSGVNNTNSSLLHTDINDLFSNWYSENSINLLLYIGAFLIVASASIFVGFQWETIGGITKALTLCFITVAFFGFGLWFYQMPKIKNAGLTFTSIGALLIPMCGIAFYNFVFKPQGVSAGSVWFVTSVISMLVYIFLIKHLQKSFFTYISSLASISVLLSTVNVFGLNKEYYILMGILGSFILFLSKTYILIRLKDQDAIISKPLEITSNVTMALSLIFGLELAAINNKVFSLESTLSLFIATSYYFLSYLSIRRAWQFLLGAILLSLTILVFCVWQKADEILIGYIMQTVALGLFIASQLLLQKELSEESDIAQILGTILTIIVPLYFFSQDIPDYNKLILALITVVTTFYTLLFSKRYFYIILSSVFMAFSIYYTVEIIHPPLRDNFMSVSYLAGGIIFYVYAVLKREDLRFSQCIGISSGLFFSLSYIFGFGIYHYLVLISLILTIIFFSAQYYFKQDRFIYISNLFLFLTTLFFLWWQKIQYPLYPLTFSTVGVALYALSFVVPFSLQKLYRDSSLVAVFLTPLVFGFDRLSYSIDAKSVERNSLLTAYAATAVFSLNAYLNQKENEGYFASAIGIITYMWQMRFIGFTETQIYSFPLGLYFCVLGFLMQRKHKLEHESVLTYIGLFILIVPTFAQSFDERGYAYAFLLGSIGAVLLFFGMTMKEKIYRYAGIIAIVLAVFSQTHEYITSLPRWMITGIAGILFLAIAIYLLLRRNINTEDKS